MQPWLTCDLMVRLRVLQTVAPLTPTEPRRIQISARPPSNLATLPDRVRNSVDRYVLLLLERVGVLVPVLLMDECPARPLVVLDGRPS